MVDSISSIFISNWEYARLCSLGFPSFGGGRGENQSIVRWPFLMVMFAARLYLRSRTEKVKKVTVF